MKYKALVGGPRTLSHRHEPQPCSREHRAHYDPRGPLSPHGGVAVDVARQVLTPLRCLARPDVAHLVTRAQPLADAVGAALFDQAPLLRFDIPRIDPAEVVLPIAGLDLL